MPFFIAVIRRDNEKETDSMAYNYPTLFSTLENDLKISSASYESQVSGNLLTRGK